MRDTFVLCDKKRALEYQPPDLVHVMLHGKARQYASKIIPRAAAAAKHAGRRPHKPWSDGTHQPRRRGMKGSSSTTTAPSQHDHFKLNPQHCTRPFHFKSPDRYPPPPSSQVCHASTFYHTSSAGVTLILLAGLILWTGERSGYSSNHLPADPTALFCLPPISGGQSRP